MGFKAREFEGMTKAELIKALRASVAREAKLRNRIAKLEEHAKHSPADYEVTGAVPAPAFPWDVK